MFYIAFLETQGRKISEQTDRNLGVDQNLRGDNEAMWVPTELLDVKISVSDMAFDVCPTNRNVYLSKIRDVKLPADSSRVLGKAAEILYFKIYDLVTKHVHEHAESKHYEKIEPWEVLHSQNPDLIEASIQGAKEKCDSADFEITDPQVLRRKLKKILAFEAHIATSLVHNQLSRMPDHRIGSFYDDLMHFSIEPTYQAELLGFSTPVKPDFVYAGKAIGDIKTGNWHDFMKLNFTAYALAYECDRHQPMNYGLIHHVQFKDTHQVPLHYHTKVEPITNELRTSFINRRDSKLEVLKNGKDPGKPNKTICEENECPFIPYCWGKN